MPLRSERSALLEAIGAGRTNKQLAGERFAGLDAAALLDRLEDDRARPRPGRSASRRPKRRLPWFGPDMGVPMFTTARYMETWAHGQEIYDLVGATRVYNDRIKHIATIGVKTFGWTFINRKQEPPGPPPYVRLEAPSGAIWEWQEPSEDECVRGSAVDFCHVVTQGRNVADTALEVRRPGGDELDGDRPMLRRRSGGSAGAGHARAERLTRPSRFRTNEPSTTRQDDDDGSGDRRAIRRPACRGARLPRRRTGRRAASAWARRTRARASSGSRC